MFIPDPGPRIWIFPFRIQGSKRQRILGPDPQHWRQPLQAERGPRDDKGGHRQSRRGNQAGSSPPPTRARTSEPEFVNF